MQEISRSEEYPFGDSNLMQNEIESTLNQIELDTGKLKNTEKLEILVSEDGTYCDNLLPKLSSYQPSWMSTIIKKWQVHDSNFYCVCNDYNPVRQMRFESWRLAQT